MVDVVIVPVNHMLRSTCCAIMRGKILWLKNTHFPSLWQCLLVSLIAGPLGGIYKQIAATAQTNRARKTAHTRKKKKHLKRVVKQLTSSGATHTDVTHHLSLRIENVKSAPHTSCDCFTSISLFEQKHVHNHSYTVDSLPKPNKHSVHCLCWNEQRDWP